MLSIPEMRLSGSHEWSLPPSKSHIIRWLTMISQSNSSCLIRFNKSPGEDAESMSKCLQEMGINIHHKEGGWLVEPPKKGLSAPNTILNCGKDRKSVV